MKMVIVLVLLVVALGGWYFAVGEKDNSPMENAAVAPVEPIPASQTPNADQTPQANTANDPKPLSGADRRFAEMQAVYEQLEKARRDLDRRLARMKMSLWKVTLPKDEAEAMSEELMSAARLLQRPKLMGAFRGLEEIRQELTRVEYAKERVRELRLQVEAMKDAGTVTDS